MLSRVKGFVRLFEHEHVGECDEELRCIGRLGVVEGQPLEEDHKNQVTEQTPEEDELKCNHNIALMVKIILQTIVEKSYKQL